MTRTTSGFKSNTSKENLSHLLSTVNAEVLKEFVHRCIDKICGRKGPSEEKFCASCGWNHSQFLEANSALEEFLVECVAQDYDRKKIEEFVSLEDNQLQAFLNCLVVRKDELQISLLRQYQNRPSQFLSDFDWKLKWVMGSSSLASYQETLLELDMTAVQHPTVPISSKSPYERISVELTRDDLSTLINTLEKAQECM